MPPDRRHRILIVTKYAVQYVRDCTAKVEGERRIEAQVEAPYPDRIFCNGRSAEPHIVLPAIAVVQLVAPQALWCSLLKGPELQRAADKSKNELKKEEEQQNSVVPDA